MEFTYGPPRHIVWEGVRWHHTKSGHYKDSTGALLHVAIWERINGRRLPDGHVVHHIDHDPGNNQPENLQLLTYAEHLRHHNAEQPRGVALGITDDYRKKMRQSWANRKPRVLTCAYCSTRFTSTGQRAKYCSLTCGERYRRESRRAQWAQPA